MLALADPPLNECRTQISALNNSSSSSSSDGVRLVLLSDQHPLVAEAVAEQLGLVGQAQKDQQGRISVIQVGNHKMTIFVAEKIKKEGILRFLDRKMSFFCGIKRKILKLN